MTRELYFSSRPFGLPSNSFGNDSDFKQVGVLSERQSNGLYTIQWAPTPPNGIVPVNPTTILGINVDGSYSPTPPQAIGNGQQFLLGDGCLICRPNWYQGHALIANAPTVPFVIAMKFAA